MVSRVDDILRMDLNDDDDDYVEYGDLSPFTATATGSSAYQHYPSVEGAEDTKPSRRSTSNATGSGVTERKSKSGVKKSSGTRDSYLDDEAGEQSPYDMPRSRDERREGKSRTSGSVGASKGRRGEEDPVDRLSGMMMQANIYDNSGNGNGSNSNNSTMRSTNRERK